MNNKKEENNIVSNLAFGTMFVAGILVFLYIIYLNFNDKENSKITSHQIISISQYLDNTVKMKKENKDFKEINNSDANLLKNENIIKDRTSNMYINDNNGKLSLVSSNYTKVFCNNLISLNKNNMEIKNLIKQYDVKMNGELITSNKVMCRDNFAKNGNMLVISEK